MKVLLALLLFSVAQAQEIPFDTAPPPPTGTTPAPKPQGDLDSIDVTPDANAPAQPDEGDTEKLYGEAEAQRQRKAEADAAAEAAKAPAKAQLSNLGGLAEFKDIAVINKRYLPKTGRVELSPSFGLILNDAFFNDFAFSGRAAFYFTEKYGLEVTGIGLSTQNKGVTDGLAQERNVNTESLATPKSYYGAAFKWAPVYGKMGFLNKSIVPFDTYFLVGGGITQTNQGTSPPTLHLGTGQIYAIRKWMAARWDFTWLGYNSETKVAGRSGGFFSNLYITIGVSFFIPEAKYR